LNELISIEGNSGFLDQQTLLINTFFVPCR